MNPGIEIEVQFFDDDVAGLRISVSNGRFSGSAGVLTSPGFAKRLADAIRGFPANATDERSEDLGTFDAAFAGGGVRLRFQCTNATGRALVQVDVREDPQMVRATASFPVSVEASGIDSFVGQLERLRLEVGARATLAAA